MKYKPKTFSVVFSSYEQFIGFRNELMKYTQKDFGDKFPALHLLTTNEEYDSGYYPIYMGYIMSHTLVLNEKYKYAMIDYAMIDKENSND